MPLDVLYEDNHLLAVNKPAGLATQGAEPGAASLYEQACAYLVRKYHKPGRAYLGVVSRLDRPVTGVVVFARTSKSAARLNAQFRARTVEKTYWAVVIPAPAEPAGRWVDGLVKDEARQRTRVVRTNTAGAQEGVLGYRTLQSLEDEALLEIHLETGRKHQIRAQCAAHGCPVVGDAKYGSRVPFSPGIALHARRLVIEHPVGGRRLEFEAPLPASWRRLGVSAG